MSNIIYRSRTALLVLVLLMVVSPVVLFAEEAAEQPKPAEVVVEVAVEETAGQPDQGEVLTKVQQRMQQEVNVDFRETPIEDVLRMLAKQADVDIVKSPEVTGNVTATLSEIPLAEALDNILAAHGYGYIATENMIRIVPRKDIYDVPERLVSRVYKITYADVVELEKALTKFVSGRGSLASMPGTSNIMVTDTETQIEAIDKFVEQVDRVTKQVLIEVRIYDVTDTENFDLGVEWNAGRNTLNSSGGVITETTGGGITYAATQPATGAAPGGVPIQTSGKRADPFAAGSFDTTTGGALRLGFLNNSISLDMLLTALHKQGYATLLANPSIMVLDNEKATFQIIKEIPYKDERQTSAGGSQTTTQFKDVGVELEVIPHITRDGMLRLHIIPEFGVVEEQPQSADGVNLVPTINTRKLDTKALLRDGQTIVLGGLRKQEASKDYWKTPLLGDLPLIGGLFRSESETVETTELIVFITPEIIEEAVLSEPQLHIYEQTDIPTVDYPALRGVK